MKGKFVKSALAIAAAGLMAFAPGAFARGHGYYGGGYHGGYGYHGGGYYHGGYYGRGHYDSAGRWIAGAINRPYEGVEISDMTAEVVDINGGPGIVMSGGGRVIGAACLAAAIGRIAPGRDQ